MKNILVVDDQSFNQTLLKSYLEQYSHQNNEPMTIDIATNGVEAVVMCESTPYDLIFMDILMPSMDGIEATRRINRILPESIIVIVSTEGDEQNQIQALRSGAKDYTVKPIQPELFKQRIKLYLTMLSTKKGLPSSKQAINLFTNNIFCFKTTYLIENEEDLAELWESLMINLRNSVRTNHLSDLIRFIYQMGRSILTREVQPQIVIEENEHSYFFSVLNINILSIQKIEQLVEGYFYSKEYRIHSNTLSFKIEKVEPESPIEEQETTSSSKADVSTVPPVIEVKSDEKTLLPLRKFDFMEQDDILSLELRLNELSSQFMWMGGNELTNNDVDQIIEAFESISAILNFYTQTQIIGFSIRDLSNLIKNDEDNFIEKAPRMTTLCKSFNNDLIQWLRSIFFEGAPSINYMDASILSNIQMIKSFLQPSAEGIDDIEFF